MKVPEGASCADSFSNPRGTGSPPFAGTNFMQSFICPSEIIYEKLFSIWSYESDSHGML